LVQYITDRPYTPSENIPSRDTNCYHFTENFELKFKIPYLQAANTWSVSTYRVSQEEQAKLREDVPYVKLYRYNPEHLCPKLNGY